MRSILTLYIVVFAQWASAGTLPQHSFIWDRARTLKPGENYFSIQTSHQAGSEAFDLQGNLQGLGHVSSGGQSWLEIAQNLSPSDRVQLNEFLKSEGLSGRELAFEQVYEMNQQRTEITPMWAYGLNRKWSVAARFPVTLIRTKIKYRSEQSSAFKKFMASRLQNSLVPGAHRSSETIDSHSEMGNFSLQTKQKLTEQDDFRFSWSQLLQFATAEKQQTDQLSETVTESSQYGLGLATHIDWGAQKNLWFYGSASFIKKFNESFRQEDSEGVREEIQIDAGDITEAQMTAEYNLFSSWRASGGYIYKEKAPDRISGVENELSHQRWEVLQMGLAFRSETLRRRFEQRDLSAALNYYTPIGGRSTLAAPTTSFEMTLIF